MENEFKGQEGQKESQETPISWKEQQKEARDQIFNVNITNLSFSQLAILQSIDDEDEFFDMFGQFVIQKQ